jgi:hypothetical protein
MATIPKPDEKEPLDVYFTRLIDENLDIPEIYLEEFYKFLDTQGQDFNQVIDSDNKHATDFGFETGKELRMHLMQEEKYNTQLKFAEIQANAQHVLNIYASEALFIETNMTTIIYTNPNLKDVAVLGVHSHQILFDLVYSTCRCMDRNVVGCIMMYFHVIDISHMINNQNQFSESDSDEE